ncbi:hypothetical protein D3C78_1872580 [compost metagenome]
MYLPATGTTFSLNVNPRFVSTATSDALLTGVNVFTNGGVVSGLATVSKIHVFSVIFLITPGVPANC